MHAFTCVSQVCIVSLLLVHPCSCCCCAMSMQVPHWLLCFIVLFLSQQIIFLHLIKDVSRRLSGICRLSPVLLQFSLFHYVFSFLSILRVSSLIQLQLTPCTESRICTVEKINTLSSVYPVSLYSVLSFLY